MNKHVFKILAMAMALLLIGGAALSEVVTTANVWLRATPSRSGEQITSYKEGKSLTFLGETAEDERPVLWYKVSDGKNTGWISSKYAKLVNEELPAATPTEAPAEEPAAAPTEAPEPESDREGDNSGDAGKLFIEALTQKAADSDVVELSAFYLDDLVTAANEIGLMDYREVASEVPFQYSNDAVIIAGNQCVEHVEVFGAGYAVFGVQVGMSVGEAMACLNAAGLDYLPNMNVVTYEHRAGTSGDNGASGKSAGYVDENGHDSCVNLYTDDRNIVIEIDWSTYTG